MTTATPLSHEECIAQFGWDRDFGARMQANAQPQEVWAECEVCGHSVSPTATTLGMPIHGECWQRLGPVGRERTARRHGVSYDQRDE
jgi:hypothetical protein